MRNIPFLRRFFQKQPERSFALNELDFKLKPYLDFKNGFFIEAGANDGVTQSNTLYYERFRGWRGLLIEPIPELAMRCRKNRPRCIVENCALVANSKLQPAVTMNYCNLMSLVKGAMPDQTIEQEHLKKGCEVQGVKSYELEVPGRSISELLFQHKIQRIDFFSLDVEGYEMEVLKGMDFQAHHPRYLLVETKDHESLSDFLKPFYSAIASLSHHDILYKAYV